METNQTEEKKIWISPELVIHGDIDQITGGVKAIQPPTDGWTLGDGSPLTTISS